MPSRTKLDKLNAVHSSTVIFRGDRRVIGNLFLNYLELIWQFRRAACPGKTHNWGVEDAFRGPALI
jgi:hypothetical protein